MIKLLYIIFCLLIATPLWAMPPAFMQGAVTQPAVGGDNCAGGETLGFTSSSATNETMGANSGAVSGLYTATCNGPLNMGLVWHNSAISDTCKLALYLDNGNGTPDDTEDTLVGITGDLVGASDEVWGTAAFVSGSVVKDSTYFLVIYPTTTQWVGGKTPDGGSAYFTDYDSSCPGYANEYGEITGAGACSYPADSGQVYSAYVTISAP